MESKDAWRATLALAFSLISSSAMNIAVFPLFDPIFSPARDISVLLSAAALVVVGVLALWKPAWLHARWLNTATVVMLAAGSVGLVASFAIASPVLLVAASSALSLARSWIAVVSGLALVRFSREEVARAVALAFIMYVLADVLLWIVPTAVGLACFLVLPPVGLALSWPLSSELVARTEAVDAPLDVAATQPATLVPFTGKLFVCLFVFRVAFGFALRTSTMFEADLLAAVPVAALGLYVLVTEKLIPSDFVARVALLSIVLGFLLGGLGTYAHPAIGNAALTAGNALFDLVAWGVLIAVGTQNDRAALAVIAWGRGVSSVGSVVGALLGVAASGIEDGQALWLLLSALVLAMVAFALFVLDGFSFTSAIDEVVPVSVEEVRLPERTLDDRCAELASRYGLTPRETEVFTMLARGRDRAYIEEKLVVSRNTVKAHVKHIYAKLDIHSHQELLDLVEDD